MSSILPSLTRIYLLLIWGLHTLSLADDEVLIKKNAVEQSAALNQDPGGADRSSLIAAEASKETIAQVTP